MKSIIIIFTFLFIALAYSSTLLRSSRAPVTAVKLNTLAQSVKAVCWISKSKKAYLIVKDAAGKAEADKLAEVKDKSVEVVLCLDWKAKKDGKKTKAAEPQTKAGAPVAGAAAHKFRTKECLDAAKAIYGTTCKSKKPAAAVAETKPAAKKWHL